MCCLLKCLFGVAFGWVVFAVNIAAAGCLLAGAFAPWYTYSGSVAGTSISLYIDGLGVAGKASGAGLTLPAYALMKDISAAMIAASAADSKIAWSTTQYNALYLGMGAQIVTAGFILFYVLLSSLFCLCTMCCWCCPKSSFFTIILAAAKLGIALCGVIALGTSFGILNTAFVALNASTAGIAAVTAAASTSTSTVVKMLAFLSNSPTTGAGQGLGSLGVALLGANLVLHIFAACKCGGASHPHDAEKKDIHKDPASASAV